MWINGTPASLLAASDRAAQFGDGSFTTARVIDGEIQYFSAHIERLKKATQRLMIEGVDWPALSAEMTHAAHLRGEGVVKAIISRGVGGRGYSPQGCSTPTRIVSSSDYPAHYHQWRQEGVKLKLSPVALSQNTLFAGIKHLNRLEQVMIRLHLDQTDAHEALVVDTSGILVECCAANIFWRKGYQVFTPELSGSGVAGIMRSHIISLLEQSGIYTISIVQQTPEILREADEVIICNALMPVLPVRQADNGYFTSSQLYDFLHPVC